MKAIVKYAVLFITYGGMYFLLECIYKHKLSDYRMFLLAGCIGIVVGLINNLFTFDTDFILQCLFGMLITTLAEAVLGYYWNTQLGLRIWDYSNLYISAIDGNVSLIFSFAWFVLSGAIIILDDYIRWKLYGEEKPYYCINGRRIFRF